MTIKQLADLCGTHKTGIRRTIDRLGLSDQLLKDENGVVQIPEHIAEKVAAQYQNEPETPQDTQEQKPEQHQTAAEQALLSALDALREQLAVKDRQLDAKDHQLAAQQQIIDTLTAALSNAQALHAGTIQQQITAARFDDRAEEPAADQGEPQPVPADQEQGTEPQEMQPERKQAKTSGTQQPKTPETPEAPKRPYKGLFGLFKRK